MRAGGRLSKHWLKRVECERSNSLREGGKFSRGSSNCFPKRREVTQGGTNVNRSSSEIGRILSFIRRCLAEGGIDWGDRISTLWGETVLGLVPNGILK